MGVAPKACGILIPQPGTEPVSPALEGGFLTTGPPGKSLHSNSWENLVEKNSGLASKDRRQAAKKKNVCMS